MNKHKNFKDDALTADWLRDNGLNHRTFDSAQLNVVRAQKMAHTLLSQHRNLLSTQQLYSLIDFEKSCGDKRKREKITDASCYWVMNTNTSVNRKLCMQKRKVKKKKTNPISD